MPTHNCRKGQYETSVPTVADRVAQTVVAEQLEEKVEPIFHPDSYGYRPGRSALDAVGGMPAAVLEERLGDRFGHPEVLRHRASRSHGKGGGGPRRFADQRWILLYVQRWLPAPLALPDGTLRQRDRGTPQGSAISPLLANLFMHYAFDVWMSREFPGVRFERYAMTRSCTASAKRQARHVRAAIADRMEQVGLRLHPDKTSIVYCKDADRRDAHEVTSFTFLGYEFRPRLAKSRTGPHFVSFLPAVSTDAKNAMRAEIRSWRLHRRSYTTLDGLARMVNSIVQGWINYYGRFYRSELLHFLRRFNNYLVRWATRKYKRLRRRPRRAMAWLAEIAQRSPQLFAHWRVGARPDGWAMGAG